MKDNRILFSCSLLYHIIRRGATDYAERGRRKVNELANRSIDGKLLTYDQTAQKSNLGIGTVMRLARESNALIKIGHIARVDWDVFFEYLRNVYRAE